MKRNILCRAWRFYADGFARMTWGRGLWLLVLIKLFVMFAILRLFFFTPHMKNMDDARQADYVREQLTHPRQ
ncbi:MAG: DUF4492 domain-containing protein [Rikenellaceae bacterium]|jgi:uncharacterized membrane protein|nr:DUF4492 domain-containing protein [Rikenellaceae bacterium]